MVKILDREVLKEKQRELKEAVKARPYLPNIRPKLRFLFQVLKLVYADIKSNRPFHSKRETNSHLEIN